MNSKGLSSESLGKTRAVGNSGLWGLGLESWAVGSCPSSFSMSSEAAVSISRVTLGGNGKVHKALIRHTLGAKIGKHQQLPFFQ